MWKIIPKTLYCVKWWFPSSEEKAFLFTTFVEIVSITEYKCWQLTTVVWFNMKGQYDGTYLSVSYIHDMLRNYIKPLSMFSDLCCHSRAMSILPNKNRKNSLEKWLSAPFHFIQAVTARSIVHPNGTNESFKCSLVHLEGMNRRLQVFCIILEGVVQDWVHFRPFLQAVQPNRG